MTRKNSLGSSRLTISMAFSPFAPESSPPPYIEIPGLFRAPSFLPTTLPTNRSRLAAVFSLRVRLAQPPHDRPASEFSVQEIVEA
jgi:hypothetical protein